MTVQKRFMLALAIVALTASYIAGCATSRPVRSYVQANVVDKTTLNGEWYYRMTVINSPYEAQFTFKGEQGEMDRIKWVVDEGYLYAYRTYANFNGTQEEDQLGTPVAAFKISSHFDIMRQYNSTTGEQINILEENSKDKFWWERRYMRVDWSQNLMTNFNWLSVNIYADLFHEMKRESIPFYTQNPNDINAPVVSKSYIDVVTKEVITPTFNDIYLPDWICFGQGFDTCIFTTYEVTYRNSFLKVDPKQHYEPLDYPDPLFEKFGYFRTEREGYNRDRGVTDIDRIYLVNRWNIWQDPYEVDANGDARLDGNGKPIAKPYAQRTVKPFVYYLNPGFNTKRPTWRATASLIVDGWNQAFKETVAELQGKLRPATVKINGQDKQMKVADTSAVPDIFLLKDNNDGYFATEAECRNKTGASHCFDIDGKWCTRMGNKDTDCRVIGDLRYSHLYIVEKPAIGSPLGYGPSAADPKTGQLIAANAFVYGAAIDTLRQRSMDYIDLIRGDMVENDVMTGEYMRQYYENMGKVWAPQVPQVDPWMPQNISQKITKKVSLKMQKKLDNMHEKLHRIDRMSRANANFYRDKLKGTSIENLLITDELAFASGNLMYDPSKDMNDTLRAHMSPLQGMSIKNFSQKQGFRDYIMGKKCVFRMNSYVDHAIWKIVKDLETKYANLAGAELRNKIADEITLRMFRGVMEHEVGHTIGLRHNFTGTFDEPNYGQLDKDPETGEWKWKTKYWEIKESIECKVDNDDDSCIDPVQKELREKAGIDQYQYTSLMDYSQSYFYNDTEGIGRWDAAAIKFGYGLLHERFTDPEGRRAGEAGFGAGMGDKYRGNRYNAQWYIGGKKCETNADCPMSAHGQTCKPLSIGGIASYKVCSNADDDWKAHDFEVVNYMFCSDDRVDDKPFCNRWDEGKSSQEIVKNMMEGYTRDYIFNNFRRYRRYFSQYSYMGRIMRAFRTVADQFQSLLYKYYYEPDFKFNDGRGGFVDMYRASVMGMNWVAQILATPDVGYTRFNEVSKKWEEVGQWDSAGAPGDMLIEYGPGKQYWSRFETGYFGQINRQWVIGTFLDKIFALETLAIRDWGRPNFNDETFLINFYDLFQRSMLDLFGALMLNDHKAYGPAVKVDRSDPSNPKLTSIHYRDIHYYDFLSNETEVDPKANFETLRQANGWEHLEPGGSFYPRLYALIYASQDFNVFYDPTFSNYMRVWLLGEGMGMDPHSQNCASTTPPGNNDIAVYDSPLFGKRYCAVQSSDKKSIAFAMVKKAANLGAARAFNEAEIARGCTTDCKVKYTSGAEAGVPATPADVEDEIRSQKYDLEDVEGFMDLMRETNRKLGFLWY